MCLTVGMIGGPYVKGMVGKVKKTPVRSVTFHANLERIAVINLDTGIEKKGEQIYYAAKLIEYPDESYQTTSLEEAKDGMKKDLYGAYIIIPSTFSTAVDSINGTPQKAVFEYQINPHLEGQDRDNMIYELTAFQDSIRNNVSYVFLDAILKEVHNVQDGSMTILANDDSERENLSGVSAEELIQTVEFTELKENNEVISPIDLSKESEGLENTAKSIGEQFDNALDNGQQDYDKITDDQDSMLTALENLKTGVSKVNPLVDEKGKSTIENGITSVNNEIDESNKKVEGQRSLLEQSMVEEINSYGKKQTDGKLKTNIHDEDFMTVAVGYWDAEVNFKIDYENNAMKYETDELEEEGEHLKEIFGKIPQKPMIVDLKKAHLGIVGDRENVHEQLQILLTQLVFAQSYHDLQIITIYDKEYEEEFSWMKWLPHSKIRALNLRGLINSEQMRDQVLGSILQILKDRKMKCEEKKNEARFAPYFLFVIDEPKLISSHAIMEYIDNNGSNLAFSVIYTTQQMANLPDSIGTVMEVLDSKKGQLVLNEKKFLNKNLELYRVGNVSLEFAELKKEQPDFMAELISTARIGRSLGVHLILATQKPSGVVDDQIWSNSKFKLALKVQDEADSREILKTADAAFITQPGRAYLQVGNNEIYELFQSAWSGATVEAGGPI